jgi:hypothetical protein
MNGGTHRASDSAIGDMRWPFMPRHTVGFHCTRPHQIRSSQKGPLLKIKRDQPGWKGASTKHLGVLYPTTASGALGSPDRSVDARAEAPSRPALPPLVAPRHVPREPRRRRAQVWGGGDPRPMIQLVPGILCFSWRVISLLDFGVPELDCGCWAPSLTEHQSYSNDTLAGHHSGHLNLTRHPRRQARPPHARTSQTSGGHPYPLCSQAQQALHLLSLAWRVHTRRYRCRPLKAGSERY